jgi:hypothetical protein
MRLLNIGLASSGLAIAMLLVAGTAQAAPGKAPEKGGTVSTGSGSTDSATPADTDPSLSVTGLTPANPDVIEAANEKKRPWGVSGTWETHRLIHQEDTTNSSNKLLNVFFFSAHYDLTAKDRVSAGWGFYQRFIADPGETGLRGDDIALTYTRFVPLPYKFAGRGSLGASLPISYDSRRASLITDLRLTLGLSRTFGDLSLDFRTSGNAFITHYTTMAGDDGYGGVPNTKWAVGLNGVAEYRMPFHHPLSIGISAGTGWRWVYDVGNSNYNSPTFFGTVNDATYTSQPILQSYRGEIFARYVMPPVAGIKTDLTVSLANGDPSLGSVSVLKEGVSQFYIFNRNTEEVYASLGVRY